MYTKCNKCGAVIVDPGTEFACPTCGNPMRTRADFLEKIEEAEEVPPSMQYGELTPFSALKAIVSGACLLSWLSYILVLILMIAIYFYAIPEVGNHINELTAIPFILLPYPVGLAVLEGPAAGVYWAFIVISFFLALVWMLWPERKLLKETFLDSLPKVRAPRRANNTTLVMVAQFFFAILFFDYLYYYMIEIGGASPNTPAFEEQKPWENLYGFLNASVWEEFAARILLIGAPLLLIIIFRSMGEGTFGEKTLDMNKATKRALRLLFGGHGEFTPITVGLIVFSSLMFGFAHAPGWDLWKVLPTAISGLGFGYLYIKKGVHAAIMLHFSFDYLGMAQGYLPNNFGTQGALLIVMLLWVAAGFVYFVYYTAKVVRFFVEPDEGWETPPVRTARRMGWDILGWK